MLRFEKNRNPFSAIKGGQYPPECHENNGLKSSVFKLGSGVSMGRNIQVGQFGVKQVGQYGLILSPGIQLLFCKPAIEGEAGVYFVEIAAMHKTELLKVIKK